MEDGCRGEEEQQGATPLLVLVRYDAHEEALSFPGGANEVSSDNIESADEQPESNMHNNNNNNVDTEAEYDGRDYHDTSVLIKKPSSNKSGIFSSFKLSYRSSDPERGVSPFAVFLLVVLLKVYILNQADRLVLPVAIPNGLRCEGSVQDECRGNISNQSAEAALNHTDCVHFSDNEQGLLTGKLWMNNVPTYAHSSCVFAVNLLLSAGRYCALAQKPNVIM